MRRVRSPAVLAGLGVLGQILYPLVHGSVRNGDTIAVVVLIGSACVLHAWRCGSGRTVLLVVVLGGFLVEQLGVHTGFPFGRYEYTSSLGVRVFRVPLVIALAWPMLAWPAALVARRLVSGFFLRVLLGAWALATWDLFLDPQMVAAGHWRWHDPSPHLPGVPHVPITNFLGWCLVALVMSVLLQRALDGHEPNARGIPIPLYLWTWASSTLALGAFLHLGGAALWGGLAMGTVAVPLALSLRKKRT